MNYNSRDLDNHITGHYGEDQDDDDYWQLGELPLYSCDREDLDDIPYWDDPTEEWEYDETGNVPSSECERPASTFWDELDDDDWPQLWADRLQGPPRS